MKLSQSEQEALTSLLTRIYFDVCPIEAEHNLLVGEGDFRPRIEYFHDAVRALSGGETDRHRLEVEWLAYDLECLRYVCAMPLSSFKPHGHSLSPRTELMQVSPNALAVKPKRLERAAKEKLVDLYRHYAVLFAALLKPASDADFHERTDALNYDVQHIHTLIEQFSHGKLDAALATIQHLDDASLRQELMGSIHKQKQNKSDTLKALLANLKKTVKQKDEEIKAVEKAHMAYGLSQLGIYEASKDLVKKMAGSGMNLAGRFVESAMAATRREMGR